MGGSKRDLGLSRSVRESSMPWDLNLSLFSFVTRVLVRVLGETHRERKRRGEGGKKRGRGNEREGRGGLA